MQKYGTIYKITNLVNKKVYIGQTIQGFNKRYCYSGKGIERVYNYHINKKNKHEKYNEYLLRSIEKYGIDNFEVIEIFDIAFSKEELDIKEKCWISIYDSIHNGYNVAEGGSNGNVLEGKTKEEIRKIGDKISKSKKGYHHSKESRLRMSKARKGTEPWNKGKTNIYSKETKLRMVNARIGKEPWNKGKKCEQFSGKNNPSARKVICITTGEIFETMKEASKKYNLKNLSSIQGCCKHRNKSAGKLEDGTKLVWLYYDEYLKNINNKSA